MIGDEREWIDAVQECQINFAAEPAQLKQRTHAERRNNDGLPVFVGLDVAFEHLVHDMRIGGWFVFQIQHDFAKELVEHVAEQRDYTGFLQVGQRGAADCPAMQAGIMRQDRDVVGCQAHVEFEHVGPGPQTGS